MSEPYLIAHKVRGEPAFDIAIKLQIGDEAGWIIPTSGHRAYPYWECPFWEIDGDSIWSNLDHPSKFPPADWPDHYEASPAPKGQGIIAASGLLDRLGLLSKTTIRRR